MRLLPLQALVCVTVLVGCVDGVPEAPCLDGLSCVEPTACAVDEDCDDAIWCNGEETCDVDLGCVAGEPPVCDDGLSCTADTCDEAVDACSFASSVEAPAAPEPLATSGGVVAWRAVRLSDGETATYDVAVDDSCDAGSLEACAMDSPEIEARDWIGTTFADPDLDALAGATVRLRACHPRTGECSPWSAGVAIE